MAGALRNVLTNWLAMALNVVIAFAMMPFVVRMLGTDGYGFWALLQAVISYMFVLDFGVRSGLNRHLARLRATADDDEAERVASTGLGVYGVIGVLVVLCAATLAAGFGSIFRVEPIDERTVFWSVMLVGVSVGVRFPGAVFDAILTSVQRYDLMNCAHILGLVVRTALVVWALTSGLGPVGIAEATLAGSLTTLTAQWCLARRVWPTLRLRVGSARMATLRMLASHSVFAYVLLTATHVITEAGTVMVGALVGASAVTFYAIAVSLTSYATTVISGISTTIPPAASRLEALGDLDGIRRLCTTGTRFILMVGLPVLVTFAMTGDLFIALWIGAGYEQTSTVLVWLSLAWGFNYVQSAAACVLIGLSRHRVAAMLVLVQAALSVGLGLALITGHGPVGVAAGAAIASVTMNTVFQYQALRTLRMPLWPFLRSGVAPALLAVGPFAVTLGLLTVSYPPVSLVGYFAEVAVSVAVMVVGALWLGLTAAERQAVGLRGRRLVSEARLALWTNRLARRVW